MPKHHCDDDDEPEQELGITTEEIREERRRVSTGLYLSYPKIVTVVAALFLGGAGAAVWLYKLTSSIEVLSGSVNGNWGVGDEEAVWRHVKRENQGFVVPDIREIYELRREKK